MENPLTPFVSHVAHWSTDFEVFELDSETCFEAMELHSGIPSLLFPGWYLTCRSCMSPCVENPKDEKGIKLSRMMWDDLILFKFEQGFRLVWLIFTLYLGVLQLLSCQQLASPTVWKFMSWAAQSVRCSQLNWLKRPLRLTQKSLEITWNSQIPSVEQGLNSASPSHEGWKKRCFGSGK